LSDAQLDAGATYVVGGTAVTVPGSFVYQPPAGTILHAGNNQTLSVTFTPTDTTDYAAATATVSLNVTQGSPSITWNAPAAIVRGTALSDTQLNASASYVVDRVGDQQRRQERRGGKDSDRENCADDDRRRTMKYFWAPPLVSRLQSGSWSVGDCLIRVPDAAVLQINAARRGRKRPFTVRPAPG